MYGWYYSEQFQSHVRCYADHGRVLAWDVISAAWIDVGQFDELRSRIEWERN